MIDLDEPVDQAKIWPRVLDSLHEKGLSLDGLGSALDCPVDELVRCAKTGWPITLVIEIAEVLGVDDFWLATGHPRPPLLTPR